jgi:hypothetical protein
MTAAPPNEIAGELFARKGRAAPLGADVASDAAAPRLPAPPLTDLFGEPVSAAVYDAVAEGAEGDAEEPPPAASLLSILGQRSAAIEADGPRRSVDFPRPHDGEAPTASLDRSEPPEEPPLEVPEAIPESAAQPGEDNEAAGPTAVEPMRSMLPVPVVSGLPVPVANDTATPRRRFPFATAAAIALAIAGAALVVYLGGPRAPVAYAPEAQTRAPGQPAAVAAAPEATESVPAARGDAFETEIETVRIDASGRTDVRGRAAPGTDLVVLHNGSPLGAVRSGDDGAWRLAARVTLGEPQHEFSVVPVQTENSVVVSGPPSRPGEAPAPARKPSLQPRYSVQIASLPTAADARREASKLAVKLSGVVGRERMEIRDATIDRGRTVFRFTVGGFVQRELADELCARIRARNETCLVMRRR